MRGTGERITFIGNTFGITPACAGNSNFWTLMLSRAEDHPRVCGEQDIPCKGGNNDRGSPPRVRGTALAGTQARNIRRITPACAGNSPQGRVALTTEQDHPRVCGEQSYLSCPRRKCRGSPPRVRGTGFMTLIDEAAERITPACAGNRPDLNQVEKLDEDHPRVCGEQHLL